MHAQYADGFQGCRDGMGREGVKGGGEGGLYYVGEEENGAILLKGCAPPFRT